MEDSGFNPTAGDGRITQRDTTPNARDAAYARENIINSFLSFGYSPTEAEVTSLISTSMGTGGEQAGQSAVANYVNFQKSEQQRQANDPLKAYQEAVTKQATDYANRSQNLYKQAQNLFTTAPKLFGSMTPDQIQQYLAPLQTAFKQAQAVTEGAGARSGTAGSSIQANALQAGNTQFQENVLAQGLQIGIDQQTKEANALLQEGSQLQGSSNSLTGMAGGAAGRRSSQDLGQSNLLASLPNFLSQEALSNRITNAQLNAGGGFQGTFDQVTGDIGKGMNALQTVEMIPGQFKTAPSASPSSPTGAPFPQGSSDINGGSSTLSSYPAYENNPYLNTAALPL